jgi:hypothetical protein
MAECRVLAAPSPRYLEPIEGSPQDKVDARRLLGELDFPHAEGRRRRVIEDLADGIDALMVLFEDPGPSKGGGELAFAINYLLVRSISDLVTGIHLGSHCYLQQAHTTLRSVIESVDLLDLFAEQQDLAERWINAEKPGQEFSPRAVREKLGRSEADLEIYGHFSEVGSHPRFAGANLVGGMLPGKGDERDTALLRIGPYFPDHPRSLEVYLWAINLLGSLALRARHLELVSGKVTKELWLQQHTEVVKAMVGAIKELREALVEMNAGSEGIDKIVTEYEQLLVKLERREAPNERR